MPKTQVTKIERAVPEFLNKNQSVGMVQLKKRELYLTNILGSKKSFSKTK